MFDVSDSLTIISHRMNKLTGKMTKDRMMDEFLDDDSLSVTARLIAADSVEKVFEGRFYGSWEFTYGVVANLEVAIVRQKNLIAA